MFSDEELERLSTRKAQIDKRKEMTTNSNPASDIDVSNVTGHLSVYRVYSDGREELMTEGNNAITNFGKTNVSRLLSGLFVSPNTADNYKYAILSFGDGAGYSTTAAIESANDVSQLISISRATGNDAALTSYTVLGRNLDSNELTVVNNNQLQVEFTLGAVSGSTSGVPPAWNDHSNNNYTSTSAITITEVGLFSNSSSALTTNPTGHSLNEMMAYKKLAGTGITFVPTEQSFSVLFRWTISFSNS